MAVLFPIDEAIDFEMIENFPNLVNADDLAFYLTDQTEAKQIVDKVRANLSTNVYSGIELPDMTQESLGKKIIRTILDRIFS